VCLALGQEVCLVSRETSAKQAKHVQTTRLFDRTYRLLILKIPHTLQSGTFFVTELKSENYKQNLLDPLI